MPDNGYVALLVMVSAAITWALRALPFAALAPMRDSAVVKYLSVHMPVGVMLMLAVYTLRTVAGDTAVEVIWLAVAVLITAGLHLWRANALTSILIGTTCYVTLMSLWG